MSVIDAACCGAIGGPTRRKAGPLGNSPGDLGVVSLFFAAIAKRLPALIEIFN
jgi:hypothetical protein